MTVHVILMSLLYAYRHPRFPSPQTTFEFGVTLQSVIFAYLPFLFQHILQVQSYWCGGTFSMVMGRAFWIMDRRGVPPQSDHTVCMCHLQMESWNSNRILQLTELRSTSTHCKGDFLRDLLPLSFMLVPLTNELPFGSPSRS